MELKKELGYMDVFSISSGAMISSGIFILPGIAFSKAGPMVILGYILGGLIAFTGILSIIELTTAMPKAGGDYFFIVRTLGPLIGTISGVLSWFAICLKTAFAIFGIAGVIGGIIYGSNLDHQTLVIISSIVTTIFLILNIIGVKIAGTFEVILVIGLLSLMGIFIAVGMFHINIDFFTPFIQIYDVVNNRLELVSSGSPFTALGAGVIVSTAAFIFVSFGGLLKVASISEEVKNPKVNIPKGMISSIAVITVVYAVTLFVTVGVLPGDQLANSLTPIADAARVLAGKPGYIVLTIASLLAFLSTANAGIMAASRYPLALSRDKLFPSFVGRVNKKFKTPTVAIISTGLLIVGSLLLPLETLVKTASAVILMTYVLTNLSVIIIRESNLSNYRPSFITPLYPWIQIFTIFVFTYFIAQLGVAAIESSIGLIFISLAIYFIYGKKNSSKEYALLHLLIRITDSLKLGHNLESELRDIIHQRDDVELTEFDKIVMEAPIIDLKSFTSLEELITLQAEKFSAILGKNHLELENLFFERENEITTAISGFTAIPHIVLDDIDTFHMAVFRCRDGIKFSEKHPQIKAVFLFVSSPKLNKLHLQTLASIATLIKDENFQKKWLEAKDENYLRDLILLRKRKNRKNK
ncbi:MULTISPECIES: amino acid permease [Psychrilyobacter]|uniref:Amino acid permease n=1 Tax=Psychrilyobacter piezotolerans TaxID=2293438 RepID=A0ABX9KI83_9FUSO|nr:MULTISPECIES: amino acid permease [Psychrilyobacter]MCS5420253.1 amino acid permease [Psychrilyobacter sp. S5]NDI77278.1 amino acid permease [Psychrilyobacter piezotolerans]RDE63332.1 amino acid permease [Psychrilyobacter sp. S5]REI41874.1 amino acid permease [Psychrilyobacter piezotolerans]